MASEAGSLMKSEPFQRFSSPPPKPPRRRHSDQSAKLKDAGMRKKHLNNGSFVSNLKTTYQDDEITYGSESLPADWVSVCNDNVENTVISKKENISKVENHFCRSLMSEMDFVEQTSTISRKKCLDDENILLSSASTWPISNNKMCISSSNISNSNITMSIDVKNISREKSSLGSDSKDDLEVGKELKVLLHRHHSDPLLSKCSHSVCCVTGSKSFSNAIQEGFTSDFMMKDFKCPHVFKDVYCISEETKVFKDGYDKLWKHLCLLQKKLDDSSTFLKEDNTSISFAELMHDVYQTQKEKDAIFEKRLKSALEERDMAVQELEDVLKSMIRIPSEDDSGEDEIEQQELKQLFKEIHGTQNPVKLLQKQRILLSCLFHAKERKLSHVSHQLKLALEEKKHAQEKVEKLEEELAKWKSSRCLLHSEAKQWEAGLVEALCQAISQRDSALAKVQCFREQIQALKIQLNSCHSKSVSSDDLHNPDYESMPKFENVSPSAYDISSISQNDCKELKNVNHSEAEFDQVRLLKCRMTYLTHQLDSETKRRQTAEENCQKLERALSLLRKKLNGVNVGVPV